MRTRIAACMQAEAPGSRRRVTTAPLRLVRAEPSWRVPASAVRPCGGATHGIFGGGDSMAAARLCRAVRGVPAAPFLRVDGGSEWNFEKERSGAIGAGGFARDNWRRRLSKIIE